MNFRLLAGVVFGSLLCAQGPAPQAPVSQDQPPTTFRGGVTNVIVPVTVTDEKGRFVSNLEASDFKIYDQGKEQKVLFFSRERNQPVVVGFLLDLSSTNRLHWDKFREAAQDLVSNLLPGDKRFSGYLITYASEPELAVDTTQDAEKIMDRIRKLKPGGGAALFDSIYMACTRRSLIQGEPIEPRRILIIIGDGHDNNSQKSLREVLELAQRNLVTIYAMSTRAFGFEAAGDANLQKLCGDTGGRVEYPLESLYGDVSGYLSTPSDEGNYAYKVGTGLYTNALLKGIYGSVVALAGEITTQYILQYAPAVPESTAVVHELRVVVNLPGAKVRSRQYYFPNAP
jgi:Ca-activated chloride channel family protein